NLGVPFTWEKGYAALLGDNPVRKISVAQILTFIALYSIILALGIGSTWLLLGGLPLGDFRGVTLTLAALVFIYLWAFLIYRLFLFVMPLKEGDIPEGSREEFVAHVNIL